MKPLYIGSDYERPIPLRTDGEKALLAQVAPRLGLVWRETAEKCFLARASDEAKPGTKPNPLPVKYYTQQDSTTGHASRMCFSSCCAMLLEYLKPGTLPGANGDDVYLRKLFSRGKTADTVKAEDQVWTLQQFKLDPVYTQQLDWEDLVRELDAGTPVPMGVLHHGHVSNPEGGGHWILAIGYEGEGEAQKLIAHDPFGEIDLVNGGWANRTPGSGKSVRYSRKNLEPRWRVKGSGGWGILA